jgi:hypothetical protein
MRPGLRRPPDSRSAPNEELPPCCQSPSKQPSPLGGGVAIFGWKGATRHGRHRFHSAGDSRGARRLLRRQAVEDEGPMGHRVAEPGLSTLRHFNARDPQARINRGSDVGRMDVPEMRLQGRQGWPRAGCTLRRHALLAYGRRVADVDHVARSARQRHHRVAPVALLMEPVPGETPLRLKLSDGRDARGNGGLLRQCRQSALLCLVSHSRSGTSNRFPMIDGRCSGLPVARSPQR